MSMQIQRIIGFSVYQTDRCWFFVINNSKEYSKPKPASNTEKSWIGSWGTPDQERKYRSNTVKYQTDKILFSWGWDIIIGPVSEFVLFTYLSWNNLHKVRTLSGR